MDELNGSADGVAFIRDTLRKIETADEESLSDVEEVIAASSTVSAGAVNPIGRTNADVKSWIQTNGFVPDQELLRLADTAIVAICSSSDLRDLWDESEGLESWLRQTRKLLSNIRVARERGLPVRKPKRKGVPRTLFGLLKRYAEEPNEKLRGRILTAVLKLSDPNEAIRGTDYEAPLSLIASFGLVEEARLLIERGADVEGDNPSRRPFVVACAGDHLEAAKLLFDKGAQIFSEVSLDKPGSAQAQITESGRLVHSYCPALFSAARFATPRIIEYLVGLGADLRQTDLNGENLLHKAAESGNLEMLKFLTASGLVVNSTKDGVFEETPLHYAVQADEIEAVRVLLELGAEPNQLVEYEGDEGMVSETPMDYTENTKIQDLLRTHGGKSATQILSGDSTSYRDT